MYKKKNTYITNKKYWQKDAACFECHSDKYIVYKSKPVRQKWEAFIIQSFSVNIPRVQVAIENHTPPIRNVSIPR